MKPSISAARKLLKQSTTLTSHASKFNSTSGGRKVSFQATFNVSEPQLFDASKIRELTAILEAFLQLSPLQPLRDCRNEAMPPQLVSRAYEKLD
jgi:hypothetical protein